MDQVEKPLDESQNHTAILKVFPSGAVYTTRSHNNMWIPGLVGIQLLRPCEDQLTRFLVTGVWESWRWTEGCLTETSWTWTRNTAAGRSPHLLPRPQSLWFKDGRRQQLDSAPLVCQSSVDQLGVLDSVEEAASDGHPGPRHHVVLDQTGQRFSILEGDTGGGHSRTTARLMALICHAVSPVCNPQSPRSQATCHVEDSSAMTSRGLTFGTRYCWSVLTSV